MSDPTTALHGAHAPAPTEPPLYVDMDGTLLRTDTLHESIWLWLRRSPLNLWRLLVWLRLGKAGFKVRLADAVRPEAHGLPRHAAFAAWLGAEHARGRTLVLASAADARIVREVAVDAGIFADTLGTEPNGPNLSGDHKRDAIAAHARASGHSAWDYAGNSASDLPVWRAARGAVAVDTPAPVLGHLRQTHPEVRVFESDPVGLRVWLKAIRLTQWAKNALLFVPLLAAHLTTLEAWGAVAVAFVAMGLCASATYLLNDLLDLPHDRRHPHKRHRPLAAGRVSVRAAVGVGLALMAAAIGLGAVVSGALVALLALYTGVTLAYSFRLKRIALLDVLVLSGLFTLRIWIGAVVAGVALSNWLLAVSMFLFLSLALAKRCAELETLRLEPAAGGAPGRGYQADDLPALRTMGVASGFMAVLVLALYIDSQNSQTLYAQPGWLWGVVPLALAWVMRVWLKVGRRELEGEDPLLHALKDPYSWLAVAATAALALMAAMGL